MILMVIISFYIFFKFFHKKLIPLLCLEAVMIFLICSFFCFKDNSDHFSLASYSLIFLVLMVLDSVLGICLLVSCSRASTSHILSL